MGKGLKVKLLTLANNDVAKSAAVSCIFLHATQFGSSNMVCIWYSCGSFLKKSVHGIWINMVNYCGIKEP
jgi:hypothetical protein